MNNSPRLIKMADAAGINVRKCENCGHIESFGVGQVGDNYVGFQFRKPGRLQSNKVDSINDFIILCTDCAFDMAGHRLEWFGRFRGSNN